VVEDSPQPNIRRARPALRCGGACSAVDTSDWRDHIVAATKRLPGQTHKNKRKKTRFIFPVLLDDVRLKISLVCWRHLSCKCRNRLISGTTNIARIRGKIAKSAKVRSMPPVDVGGEIWMHGSHVLDGSALPLTVDGETSFGVHLSAHVAMHRDDALIRAILIHEFAHCFYYVRTGKKYWSQVM
jgi:hypothetical protein